MLTFVSAIRYCGEKPRPTQNLNATMAIMLLSVGCASFTTTQTDVRPKFNRIPRNRDYVCRTYFATPQDGILRNGRLGSQRYANNAALTR